MACAGGIDSVYGLGLVWAWTEVGEGLRREKGREAEVSGWVDSVGGGESMTLICEADCEGAIDERSDAGCPESELECVGGRGLREGE